MQRGSWDDILARGMGQFVWRYGVVCFGGLFFVTNTLVRWLGNDPNLRYAATSVASLVAISFAYSLSLGAAFGLLAWHAVRAIRWMTKLRMRKPSISEVSTVAAKSRSAAGNK